MTFLAIEKFKKKWSKQTFSKIVLKNTHVFTFHITGRAQRPIFFTNILARISQKETPHMTPFWKISFSTSERLTKREKQLAKQGFELLNSDFWICSSTHIKTTHVRWP